MDLEAKFEPNLLNTAIYLLGLSQQVSTFAINFQVILLPCTAAASCTDTRASQGRLIRSTLR